MAEVQWTSRSRRTPDEVWAKVGDFGGVGDFFPGIESFRLEGDDRVIGMFGMEIRERLLARDDAARTITYSVVEGVPDREPHGHHRGEPEGDGSKVTGPTTSTPDEMAPIFGDTYKAGAGRARERPSADTGLERGGADRSGPPTLTP